MLRKFFKKKEPSIEEFRLLYDMFYSRVYQDAYFITKDSHLAQDALQETFVKAYKHMNHLEDKERIGAWLSTIATRTAIDLIRKRKGNRELLSGDLTLQEKHLPHMTVDIAKMVENNTAKDELLNVINEMKEEYREIILLRYIHDMTIKEIAFYLDLKEGTVKTRLHRARHSIKKVIENDPKRRWIGGGMG